MNWKRISLMLTLALALLLSSMIILRTPSVEAAPPTPQRGPRAPGLELIFYPSVEAEYAALVAGDIDYLGMLTAPQYDDAKTRPDIETYLETTWSMVDEAFHSAYYNPSYPNWRSPMNDTAFRKAVLHLVNKEHYIENIYLGLAERIDVPVAAPGADWMNASIIGANYPYPYNPATAVAVLNAAGWNDTGDADTILNYPEGWDGRPGRPNMDPIQYWIYDDPPERYEQAHHLAEEMRAVGIPVDEHPAPWQLINDQCWCAYDYHISSDGWNVGRFPCSFIQFIFDSSNYMQGYCGANAYYPGNYRLDEAVRNARYAPNATTAKFWTMRAQSIIMDELALMLPVRSGKGFYASKNLCGLVKMGGGAPYNDYSEMNAYRADDPSQPIRVGLDAPPNINTIYCMWTNGYFVMQRVWPDMMSLYPMSVSAPEHPALFKDWADTLWYDGPDAKSLCRFWLKEGAYWIKPGDPGVDPEAGTPLAPFNTTGMEFGIWYQYQTTDAWWHADYSTIHHIRTDPTDPFYIEYYWDEVSFLHYLDGWSTHTAIYSLEPGKYYKQTPIVIDGDLVTAGLQPSTAVFVEDTNMTTPGDLGLPHQTIGAPVEIVSIVEEGVGALTPSDVSGDNDYEIVEGYIHLYKNIGSGGKITVTYWARDDARGTTAGNIPWQETIVGAGKWYMTSWNILTGATFKPNRYHHLETPPLAETDWILYWDGTTKPRDSYYKVSIYDVSLTTAIYGASGRLVPDASWDPTMDLAPSGDGLPGKIDIYDVSSITASYGKSFWETS